MRVVSQLPGRGPLLWILPLYLHVNKKSDDDDDGLGHMTKTAATPVMVKSLKNLLLQNQRADCNETCYEALGIRAHYNLFKL